MSGDKIQIFKATTNKILKDAGFQRIKEYYVHQGSGMLFQITAYNSKKGLKIKLVYDEASTIWHCSLSLRNRNGNYISGNYVRYASLGELLLEASLEKNQVKKEKNGKDERMVWHQPSKEWWFTDHNSVRKQIVILKATCHGYCAIDDTGSCMFDDLAKPDTEGYFIVECYDLRNRTFYMIFQNDEEFLIGLKRGRKNGKPLIKIVNDKILFDNGSNPFVVADLTVEDFRMAIESTKKFNE